MDNSNILHEYCARFGITHAADVASKATTLAMEKYQAMTQRVPTQEEAASIQLMIDELSDWSAPKAYVISAA